MQIRSIKKKEQERAIFIISQSFFYTCESERKLLENDKFRYEEFIGAFTDDNKMAAVLQCEPHYMWLNGKSVKSGGIANVSTLPEHRQGGMVRNMMKKICNTMYDNGCTMSYLYPFSYEYYRKFGYEMCNEMLRIEASPDDIGDLPFIGKAKQFEHGEEGTDPSDIIEIYTEFSSRYNIMLDRDAWQWERKLEHDPVLSNIRTYIIYDENSIACAYFTYTYKREGYSSELNITDIAWKNSESKYQLFAFLKRFSGNVKKMKFHVPPEMVMSYIWPEPKKCEVFYEHSGMARVINAKAALETIFLKKDESFTIKINDSFMEQNNKSYKVYDKDSETHVQEYDGECDIECSVQALAQILTGFASLETAQSRSDVKIAANKETLLEAFPKKMVYIADFF